MFTLLRPRSAPSADDLTHLSADEWLAGVLSLDRRGLRDLERLMHKTADTGLYASFWRSGVEELATLAGGEETLEHRLAPIMAEADSAFAAQPNTLRNPTLAARHIAIIYLALRHRRNLSRKATYGLLQPLLSH